MGNTAILQQTSDLPNVQRNLNSAGSHRAAGHIRFRAVLNRKTSESTLVYNQVMWTDSPLTLIKNRINEFKSALVDVEDDEFLGVQIYKNAEFALGNLEGFLHLLNADEVGPSEHGTLFMNFQSDSKSLVLEIGNSTAGAVFMDNLGNMNTLSNSIENQRFWEDINALLSKEF